MALTIDDLRRLDQSAGQKVRNVYDQVSARIQQPDLERRDLAEYHAMNDTEHGTLMRAVGADKYQEYVSAMEQLKQKYGG